MAHGHVRRPLLPVMAGGGLLDCVLDSAPAWAGTVAADAVRKGQFSGRPSVEPSAAVGCGVILRSSSIVVYWSGCLQPRPLFVCRGASLISIVGRHSSYDLSLPACRLLYALLSLTPRCLFTRASLPLTILRSIACRARSFLFRKPSCFCAFASAPRRAPAPSSPRRSLAFLGRRSFSLAFVCFGPSVRILVLRCVSKRPRYAS